MSAWAAQLRRRSAADRFDLYTRVSLYVLSAGEVVVAVAIATGPPRIEPVWGATFIALAVLHAASGVALLHRGINWFLGHGSWPRQVMVLHIVLGGCGVLSALLAFPHVDGGDPEGYGSAAFGVLMFIIYVIVALTPRLTMLRLASTAVSSAVLAGLAMLAFGWSFRPAMAGAVSCLIGMVAGGSTYRISVWMLGAVWETERSRETESRLAVAEERLRIARDLHDVLGRNLSVIALKSELAAQLSRRGRDEAPAEMMEVHEIAHDSLREVREVVRGYRHADLAAELAGARSVLRSAGVDSRIIGDGTQLPWQAQDALAWVVREGTTNVLRHSDATECVITVEKAPSGTTEVQWASVTMENNRAREEQPAERGGNGLAGLGERLEGLGGTLRAESLQGGRFRLTAIVPVRPAPDDERTPRAESPTLKETP
ncbi:sensor histidine kinase [Phytoactinopolyspora mesophila]|nr:histidine kinase [Phytoactinopolyspora mesophila]